MTAERARQVSQPEKFGTSMPLFNEGRLSTLQQMIADGLPMRMAQKWSGILAVDNTYNPVGPLDPWDFPPYYDNPAASDALLAVFRADAEKAVDLGIRWRMLGNPADAEAVARIITPWANIGTISTAGDSRLNWSNKFPLFIQAAQLISDSAAYTPSLKTAMENIVSRGLSYSSAFVQTENRAMWGCMYNVAAAAFLNDRPTMTKAIARWREVFDSDVKDNIPFREILRGDNGLYYSNFLLNAMVQTAEIARFNGEWLYDFRTSDGSTFKGLWERVARWTAVPAEYPYWAGSSTVRIQAHVDPLHALWPNADSQKLIDTYTTTQDYFGYRHGILAYRDRPLYG
ncbi:alginate lyase family protein [Microbacterium sp. AR7-10]|uniref:alginate lyase family protein n=1 Tax=Microbacterium sp. AR7-10 TaxID=1891970 RepID=UPI00210A1C55|nr:alginate lyase family protein [Microbacterium sp. AR7-10]